MFPYPACSLGLLLVVVLLLNACGGGSDPDNAVVKTPDTPVVDRLNVLLIVGDDLGPQIGIYGDHQARTPHIDQLAAAGVLFDQAYVTQASCSSSRSSILTGLYPMQNGQLGLASSLPEYQIKPGIDTLPALLQKAGYLTGILGKLHLGPDAAFPFNYEWARSNDAIASRDVARVALLADEFLSQAGDKPFFLYVNFFDPHRPFDEGANSFLGLPEQPRTLDEVEPFPYLGLDGPQIRSEIAAYYNSVSRLDTGVGKLLEILSKHGARDDTLVIFLGDHGPPFTRAKTTSYEAGIQIPMIVSWPGVGIDGLRSPSLVSTVDLLPTVLDAIGLEAPAVAGSSLREVMWDTPPDNWRKWLFTEYTSHAKAHFFPRRSVRGARFKLIHNLDAGRPNPIPYEGRTRPLNAEVVSDAVVRAYQTHELPPALELYDLQSDPHELHNLADDPAHAATLSELQTVLEQWREEMGDPLLDPAELDRLRSAHGIDKP